MPRRVGSWAKGHFARPAHAHAGPLPTRLPRAKVIAAIGVLAVLIFSKYMYLASLSSYYTFYLIERFAVPVHESQIYLFVFLGAMAAGTIVGGPVGDRVGRKAVIWISILGILPFTLALPYVNLFWTVVLTAVIGVVLAKRVNEGGPDQRRLGAGATVRLRTLHSTSPWITSRNVRRSASSSRGTPSHAG